MFLLLIPGRPSPLTDCRISANVSSSSDNNNDKNKNGASQYSGFWVNCRAGFDGGLPQTFLLELYEEDVLKSKVWFKLQK